MKFIALFIVGKETPLHDVLRAKANHAPASSVPTSTPVGRDVPASSFTPASAAVPLPAASSVASFSRPSASEGIRYTEVTDDDTGRVTFKCTMCSFTAMFKIAIIKHLAANHFDQQQHGTVTMVPQRPSTSASPLLNANAKIGKLASSPAASAADFDNSVAEGCIKTAGASGKVQRSKALASSSRDNARHAHFTETSKSSSSKTAAKSTGLAKKHVTKTAPSSPAKPQPLSRQAEVQNILSASTVSCTRVGFL